MHLRCISDNSRNCADNIALDEIVFTNEPFISTFRFYTWTQTAYTIGYFQKLDDIKNLNNLPVVRRLTGGLAVLHDKDLSFSFIASDQIWPHIYNQEKTYGMIHSTLKQTLAFFNIICDKQPVSAVSNKNISCVDVFYKDDLFLNGKKIAGSCQRRRGRRILVEGSVHLNFDAKTVKSFSAEFFKNIAKTLNRPVSIENLTDYEFNAGRQLADSKYNNDKWRKLF